jgi:hypothetical protein
MISSMSDGKVGLGEVKFARIGKYTSREVIAQTEKEPVSLAMNFLESMNCNASMLV